eukprot:2507568-Lingulodinium_polyedra.AAC.1
MVHFADAEGRACGMAFQIAKVERPLISVARLTATGHKVSFEKSGGRILHEASGRVLPLKREGGVYILEMRVKLASREGFHRQEQ